MLAALVVSQQMAAFLHLCAIYTSTESTSTHWSILSNNRCHRSDKTFTLAITQEGEEVKTRSEEIAAFFVSFFIFQGFFQILIL